MFSRAREASELAPSSAAKARGAAQPNKQDQVQIKITDQASTRDRFIHTSLGMGRGKKWKSSELIVLMKPTRHKYKTAPTAMPMHAHPSAGRMRCSPIQSNTPCPCRLGSITSEVKNHIPGAKHTFVASHCPPASPAWCNSSSACSSVSHTTGAPKAG